MQKVSVKLDMLKWAEVCAALQGYIQGCKAYENVSRRDACLALQEIDRVLSGRVTVAPLDDLLGPGRDEA